MVASIREDALIDRWRLYKIAHQASPQSHKEPTNLAVGGKPALLNEKIARRRLLVLPLCLIAPKFLANGLGPGTSQPAPHRFDVLEHTLRAVDACDRLLAGLPTLEPFGAELAAHVAEPLGGGITRRQVLKLATLLHDVSKPETRRSVGGRVRFLEHDVIGAAKARAIGQRLRLPERAIAVLERLVRHHLRPMHLAASVGTRCVAIFSAPPSDSRS